MLLCLFIWFNHESIAVNNGLGWDGVTYSNMTKNFTTLFHEQSFNSYYFQKILLPGIACFIVFLWNMVREFFNVGAPIELTDGVVIQVFSLVNFFILIVSGMIFLKIMGLFNFKAGTKILGFSLLFFSFATLKQNFYYPVLIDTLAFSLGILTLYFYLANKYTALLIASVIGYFSFPTIFYMGIILFIFENKTTKRQIKLDRFFSLKEKFFLMTLVFLILIYIIIIYLNLFTKYTVTRTGNNLSAISILVAICYVYVMERYLITNDFINGIINSVSIKKIIISVSLFIFLKGLNFYYSYHSDHSWVPMSMSSYIYLILCESIINPGTFLVSHFFYFGPFIPLLFFFWGDFLIELKEQSYGYQTLVVIFIFSALGSESRQLINAVPFFVFLLIRVLDRCDFKNFFYGIMILLSLIVSRFWFNFNMAQSDVQHSSDLFPAQYYFMNQGPWMSDSMYIVGLVLMLLFFLLMWVLINISSSSKIKFFRL